MKDEDVESHHRTFSYAVVSFIRSNQVDDASFLAAGLSGDRFQFDEQGDGPARYNIIHFKQVSAGRYRWEHVGKYQFGQLQLDMKGKFPTTILWSYWHAHNSLAELMNTTRASYTILGPYQWLDLSTSS